MEEDLKARLLKPRLGEEEIEIEGVGVVRIRALTRGEVLRLTPQKMAMRERMMLTWGMVDPRMTEDEVAAWSKASPAGELERVTIAIARLSGLEVGQPKEVYKEFDDDPDAEFRVLPSAETADDGGRAALADD